jgi:hypothetical protein
MANLTCGLSTVGAVAVRAKRLNCDGTEVGELDAQAAVAGYVSCKFTEVTLTPVVIEGDTIQQNNADGKLCINVERDDQITGYTIEIEQCDIDAEFQEILGAVESIITNAGGDTIGAELSGGTQTCSCGDATSACRDIVFEFWLRAYNCNEEAGFVRYIIPSVKFTPGGNTETFGNAATLRRFTGTAKPNTNISPTGPWSDLPAGVALTGNSPVYFYESALPAGVDADQCTYLPWDFAPSV